MEKAELNFKFAKIISSNLKCLQYFGLVLPDKDTLIYLPYIRTIFFTGKFQ